MAKAAKYRCARCHLITWRKSDKAWIASWCDKTGSTTRLMRLDRLKGSKSNG